MCIIKSKFLLITFLLSISLSIFADENSEATNRFTLTNGYWDTKYNSNEGIVYFPLSVIDTYSWGFRKLSLDSNIFGRSFSFILSLYLVNYINTTYLNTPFHEFGHATRFQSYGYNITRYNVGEDNSVTANSYFEMVFKRAKTGPVGASTSGNFSILSTSQDLIVTAGGMNNETLLSERLSDRIYERGGSVPDLFYHYYNKKGPYDYFNISSSSGDPTIILNTYKTLGLNISKQNIMDSYTFSLLASGTFYSLLWGNIKYFYNGEQNIKPIDIFGFSLPDFYTYLNSRGLSIETILHYRVNEALSFGLSYEKVYNGTPYDEFGPQFRLALKLNSNYLKFLIIKPQLLIGAGDNVDWGGSLLTELEGTYFGTFAKYTYYNSNTLYGERNNPFINTPNELLAGFFVNLR
ncbi:hypothetical protein [Fluviispira vulneris]|uniref:hypothetical protein n=1 Tax=Fluviispira vulneris TaxID=2763012 RepID=UPI001648395B|nr:hypothetical protein [Fluviispira vulneris]